MIDWWFVGWHAIWIAGAALVLSSWSYHHWLAAMRVVSREEVFRRPAWVLASGTGGALVCIGLAALSRWWEAILWAALACASAVRAWRGIPGARWKL